MKNAFLWKPTKVIKRNDRFIVSPDRRQVAVGSRLITSIQVRHYEEAIRKHARGQLLDLGCGSVPYYEMYKDLITDSVCIDWENSLHNNAFVDLTQDLTKPLRLPPAAFDTVLSTDVLEHIASPWLLFSEIARVLRPGGILLLGVPFFYWLHETPYDFFRYTEFGLRSLCETNSLAPLSIVAYGGVPEVLADIAGKCIQGAGLRPLCSLHVAVSRQLLRTRPVQAVTRATAKSFPLGYLLVARKTVVADADLDTDRHAA